MTSGVKGSSTTEIVIGPDDTLLDVFDRVRETGDRPVALTIPNESSLFLTAAEFRTLRDVADHGRHEVTIRTSDPLRRQLARLLGLEVARIAAPPPGGTAPVPQAPSPGAATKPATPAKPATGAQPAVAAQPTTTSQPAPPAGDEAGPNVPVPASAPPPGASAAAASPATCSDSAKTAPAAPAGASKAKPAVAAGPTTAAPAAGATAEVDPAAAAESAISEHEAVARWPAEPVEPRPVPGAPRRLVDRIAAGLGVSRRAVPETIPAADEPGPAASDEDVAANGAAAPAEELPDRIHWVGDRRLSARVLAGVLVAALLLFIAVAVVLPSATVELELASVPINSELVFDVTRDGEPLDDQAAFALAGEPLTMTVVVEASMPTTGVRAIPDGLAAGTVRLANPTASEQTVDAGTILTTESGVEFAVTDQVVVPAADPATRAAGQADAAIQAVNPGAGGNVETGEIGGKLPNGVYYSNRSGATAGGADREVRTVAQADLDGLVAQADAELIDQIQSELRADAATADLAVLASSITVDDGSNAFDHELDAEADQVGIRAERTVSLLAYDQAEASAQLADVLGGQLQALVPPGFALGPVALGSDDVTEVEGTAEGGRLRFDAGARATLVLTDAKRIELAGQLAGKSEADANVLLKSVPEVSSFAIEPGFRLFSSNLPPLAARIEIVDGSGG